jgi:ABC-type proline/glycine betaine transport system substrate-binding protein
MFLGKNRKEYTLEFYSKNFLKNKGYYDTLQENILYQLDISYSNKAYEFRLIYNIKYNNDGNYSGIITDKYIINENPLITTDFIDVGGFFDNDTFKGKIYAISVINNSSPETEVTFLLPNSTLLSQIMLPLPK